MSKFARHTAFALGAEVVIFIGSLLLGLITARTLGPSGKGILGVVSGAYMILASILSLRFERAVTYYTAKDPGSASKTLGGAFAMGGIAAICLIPVLFFLPESAKFYLFGGVPAEYVTAAGLYFVNHYFMLVIGGVFAGQHRFKRRLGFLALFYGEKAAFAFIGLALLHFSLRDYLIAASLVDLAFNVSCFIFIYRVNRWKFEFGRNHMWAMIRYASAGFFGVPAELVLANLCLFVLSATHGSSEAGLFVVAIMLSTTLGYLADGMKVVVLPSVASNGNIDESRVRRFLLLIELVMAAGLLLVGRQLLVLFFGEQFEGSYWPTILLVPGVIGATYRNVLSASIQGRGAPGKAAFAALVGAVVEIIGAFTLIPRYGIFGAAGAMSIANIAGAIPAIFIFVRMTGTSIRSLFFVRMAEIRELISYAKAQMKALRNGPAPAKEEHDVAEIK